MRARLSFALLIMFVSTSLGFGSVVCHDGDRNASNEVALLHAALDAFGREDEHGHDHATDHLDVLSFDDLRLSSHMPAVEGRLSRDIDDVATASLSVTPVASTSRPNWGPDATDVLKRKVDTIVLTV